MKNKVLFIDSVHPALEGMLSANGWYCIDGTSMSYSNILDTIPAFTGIVIRSRFRIGQELLSRAVNLKFIARAGAGMENIDLEAAQAAGVKCINAPEGNRNAVAEHALGMLLALMNNMLQADAQVRNGLWKREENRGNEIAGKTAAIIGFGNTGSAFASKLVSLGVHVLAYDPFITIPKKDWPGVVQADMEYIYAQADILSLHVPLTKETTKLVNKEYLSKFKKPVYLVNTSRGSVVSIDDLNIALEQKIIRGAALDVLEFEHFSFENLPFEQAPDAFNKLCTFGQVILSPHVAGWTVESHRMISEVLGQKIINEFNRAVS